MALLEGVRRFFGRKTDEQTVDLTATQAEGLARSVATAAPSAESRTGSGGRAIASLEPKFFGNSRSRSIAELQQSYDEVMGLVRKIGDHLDAQAARYDDQSQVLQRLPDALSVLPEINRQNSRLLELLSEHLDRASEQDRSLNNTLARIGETTIQQSEVLGMVQRQLDTNNESAKQMTGTLMEFRNSLAELGQSNTRSVQVLAKMASAADERESKLEAMLGRTQKWMIGAVLCCAAASVIALIIAMASLAR